MARPRKTTEVQSNNDEFIRGKYSVTKPNDKYVVRHGGNVVYATESLDEVHKYLELVNS